MAAEYLFARGQKERERHHGSFESSVSGEKVPYCPE